MNIGSILTVAAERWADQPAIRCGGLERTFHEWNARSSALADDLRAGGVRSGDRVALLQHNGPALLECLFAVFKAGAVAVPINARLHHEEYSFIIDHCDAKAVLFGSAFRSGLEATGVMAGRRGVVTDGAALDWAEALDDVIARGSDTREDAVTAADDVCWLFYTSGTTGRPKGAMITHGNLRFMCDQYPREVREVPAGEVCLHVAALTHASGLWALPLTEAGAVHLLTETSSFDPDGTLQLIERARAVQVVFLAPTMLTMLLDAASIGTVDVSSVELVGYGGSPAYSTELRRAIERFGPVFCQIYGQGECPMTITMLRPEDHALDHPRIDDLLTSAGRPREGIEVVVLGPDDEVLGPGVEGEVAVRGPVVMRGYWHNPAATAEAFTGNPHDPASWYRSGDIGRFDEEGYLYLLDRVKDLIITGGSNVYGREVEDVLLRHPDVHEVAVIGTPDRTWGERVTAVVVLRDGAAEDVEALAALCAGSLAGYKKPRRWEFTTELPKNGYGKVLKRELRDALVRDDPTP